MTTAPAVAPTCPICGQRRRPQYDYRVDLRRNSRSATSTPNSISSSLTAGRACSKSKRSRPNSWRNSPVAAAPANADTS